jgi:hypothetical protein
MSAENTESMKKKMLCKTPGVIYETEEHIGPSSTYQTSNHCYEMWPTKLPSVDHVQISWMKT